MARPGTPFKPIFPMVLAFRAGGDGSPQICVAQKLASWTRISLVHLILLRFPL